MSEGALRRTILTVNIEILSTLLNVCWNILTYFQYWKYWWDGLIKTKMCNIDNICLQSFVIAIFFPIPHCLFSSNNWIHSRYILIVWGQCSFSLSTILTIFCWQILFVRMSLDTLFKNRYSALLQLLTLVIEPSIFCYWMYQQHRAEIGQKDVSPKNSSSC